jgi:hypothetical protein
MVPVRALIPLLTLAACTASPPTAVAPDVTLVRDAVTAPDVLPPTDLIDAPEPADLPPPRLPRPPSTRALRDLLGFSLPGRDLPAGTHAAAVARRRWAWSALRDLGVRRVRREVFWRDVEPMPGRLRWDDYDPIVAEAASEGVSLLGVLAYGNTWASSLPGATDFHPPDDPAVFARFAVEVVRRYGDRVRDWEVWNEPNAGFRFWRSRATGDPRAFGALVRATVDAVRGVDPTARVAFGGTVFLPQVIPGGVAFSREALAMNPGLARSLDAFAMHAYTLYPPRVSPEFAGPRELPHVDKVQEMLGGIAAEGYDPARPLWITEVGWPVIATVTEERQARYLTRTALLSALAGVDGVWLYELGDGPGGADDLVPEDSFGIFRHDPDVTDDVPPAPKPALVALRAMLRAVGDLRVVARETPVGAPEDVYVLALQGDGSTRGWVAWRANDDASPWRWAAPAGAVTSMRGDEVAREGGAVAVTGAPVFVRAQPGA